MSVQGPEFKIASDGKVTQTYPPRCPDPDCDGEEGHDGLHHAWVPDFGDEDE